jgi:stearoyl-CoA desaturase (delta-9 desaturase)
VIHSRHCTFLINSLAHWTGEQEYTTEVSARGGLILALLTVGEGHHNYHHAFPNDYRNGVKFWDWDPTKWVIYACSLVGLAWDLRRVENGEIAKAKVLVQEQNIAEERERLDWGLPDSELPLLTRAQVRDLAKGPEKRKLIVIGSDITDVRDFEGHHPGGTGLLRAYYGRDATLPFEGGYNRHTQAAINLVKRYRIAMLDPSETAVVSKSDDE